MVPYCAVCFESTPYGLRGGFITPAVREVNKVPYCEEHARAWETYLKSKNQEGSHES